MSSIEYRELQRKKLARGETIGDEAYTAAVRDHLRAAGETVPEPEVKLSMSRTIKKFQDRRRNTRTDPKDYRTKTQP